MRGGGWGYGVGGNVRERSAWVRVGGAKRLRIAMGEEWWCGGVGDGRSRVVEGGQRESGREINSEAWGEGSHGYGWVGEKAGSCGNVCYPSGPRTT